MSVSKHFEAGRALKAARERRKMSHDRLALLVNSSRQHLIRLEQGLHRPKPEMTAALTEALDADVASFYEVEGSGDDLADEEAAEMVRLLQRMIRRAQAAA